MLPFASLRCAWSNATSCESGVFGSAQAVCMPRLEPKVYHQYCVCPGASHTGARKLLKAIVALLRVDDVDEWTCGTDRVCEALEAPSPRAGVERCACRPCPRAQDTSGSPPATDS